MKRVFALLVALVFGMSLAPRAEAARVKDITLVNGGRDNQLVGYGLVVGLANRGDSKLAFTVQTIANALQKFGVVIPPQVIKSDNVAAVMVTADIPAFSRVGTRLDVTVASIGDAKTISGGVLLQTPLVGADDTVYAVAQGAVAIGGFIGGEGGPGGATVQKNHPTTGMITGGALVEREIPSTFVRDRSVELILLNPDFASAARMAQSINQIFPQSALAKDSATVNVCVPEDYVGYEVNFIASLGAIEVEPDVPARVVINERTGTIIATSNVRVSTLAISHGSLTITVASTQAVSQPGLGARAGQTAVTRSTNATANEAKASFGVIAGPEDSAVKPTIQDVANALNALGLTTRDMMAIFQTMKRAGALQAELILN